VPPVVTELEPAAVPAVGTLGHEDLVALGRGVAALTRHGQHVLLHGEVDGVRVHPGHVEVDDQLPVTTVGVHGHGGAEPRVGEVPKRGKGNQHRVFSPVLGEIVVVAS
jgi:hypothetical protein